MKRQRKRLTEGILYPFIASTKPEYKAYHQAKYRCQNANCTSYPGYGGRGIEFHFTSFHQFYDLLGERPEGTSLDRINNDGHYEPGNVRWATKGQQSVNKRLPRPKSPETCRKISEGLKGKPRPDMIGNDFGGGRARWKGHVATPNAERQRQHRRRKALET